MQHQAEPDTDRPFWVHVSRAKEPTELLVEPPFKAELGVVFLRLTQGGGQAGIWLSRDEWEAFKQAGDACVDWAGRHSY